jgi:hypothetical protein
MEIHHPHHPTHKKKWAEYILEFVMLFAAVTLGFFAENYREHTIIEHRMQENYEAIIIDLKQDNAKIEGIFKEGEAIPNLIKLSHTLYQYQKLQITESVLIDSLYNIRRIPSYSTLFINNTTFKNLQSSGLLTYVTNKDLKSGLSYYYEVIFKKINDNNKLFDDVGINYFDNYLFYNQATQLRNKLKNEYAKYENEYKNPDEYRRFLMNLESSKKMLTSDAFVKNTSTYLSRYIDYQGILNNVKKNNEELIKLIEKNIKH